MARTFNLDDPEQKRAYWEETTWQVIAYGGLYQSFDFRRNTITVHDAPDVTAEVREPEP